MISDDEARALAQLVGLYAVDVPGVGLEITNGLKFLSPTVQGVWYPIDYVGVRPEKFPVERANNYSQWMALGCPIPD